MSYNEIFLESGQRARYQNIATKILDALEKLRTETGSSSSARRRWVWELIQNAKDVHPHGGVEIHIGFAAQSPNPHVKFQHNGKPFTVENIRFLIEQVSTKDRSKDEEGKHKATGRFGTGFLTTHLLSEKVVVQGIVQEPKHEPRQFELELDRSGADPEQLIEAVKRATESVKNLDELPAYHEYVEGKLSTSFRYPLADSMALRAATTGIDDLDNSLPYALIFVDEIKSVEVSPGKRYYRATTGKRALAENIYLHSVTIESDRGFQSFSIIRLTTGFTSIAVPVRCEGETIDLLPIGDEVPKIFCDFPLVGTELFSFPAIINNPYFNPTEPRDGIRLTTPERKSLQVEENKSIIQEVVKLYFHLLEFAIRNNWTHLHLLTPVYHSSFSPQWMDGTWFKAQVLEPIRKKLLYANIVRTADMKLAPILSGDGKPFIRFPSAESKELREKIWRCASSLLPDRLPREVDIELWHKLTSNWNECERLTLEKIAIFVEAQTTQAKLASVLKGADPIAWLNDFYAILRTHERDYNSIVSKRAIFPNQNGDFHTKAQLYRDAGDIGDELKDILKLLGKDLRAELVLDNVVEDFGSKMVLNQAAVVKTIISEVEIKANDRTIAKKFGPAFKKLLFFFKKKPELAGQLFASIYQRKHILYDDDEILENVNMSEQVKDLFTEFQVETLEGLRKLLASTQSAQPEPLPISQDILAGMGITSMAAWEEAIKDKNLAALFSHESTPTVEMFLRSQIMVARAKDRIIAHLESLLNYDLSKMDRTAPTILAGIIKDGLEIHVVTRPSDGGMVIIHSKSEYDVLDYETSELWVDDGKETRRISLGHILKTAQIRKFPV